MLHGTRTVLYARFSSDNQRSESIDAQVRAMTDYCKHNNLTIIHTYIDEAKSATTDRRPSFQQMISDSVKQEFDIVLVHKLDRFARNRYDSAVYKRELKKNGVTVYSVLENLDDSPESIMMESVLEGMSEYYSQNLAREVMKGMRETALQCKHTGGKPPLGFDVDTNTHKLIINEYEAATVRLIFSMYLEGFGYESISEQLNKQGRKTKFGQSFSKSSLKGILTNIKYTGVYVFNRSASKAADGTRNSHKYKDKDEQIIIEGGVPRIIDDETYYKVQDIMKNRTHMGCRDTAKERYILSGKVFCKDCGHAMSGYCSYSGRNKDKYAGYRCTSRKFDCRNKAVNRDYLEHYVIEILDKEIFNAKTMKSIERRIAKQYDLADTDYAHRLESIDKELIAIEESLQNVADAISKGIKSQTLTEHLTTLEYKRDALEAEKAGLMIRGKRAAKALDTQAILDEYNELRTDTQSFRFKVFIDDYIDSIIVGRYDVKVRLKTGLGMFDSLDTEHLITRQAIYQRSKNKNEISHNHRRDSK